MSDAASPPRPPHPAVFALGVLWASPMSLLGLIAGLACMPFGARPRLRRDAYALVFHRVPMGPGGAMTLGNVILSTAEHLDARCRTYAHRAGWCEEPLTRIGDHERAHVLQYMSLGVLFLPLYFLHGGIHARNRFERAADRYALTGEGWWPWDAGNGRKAYIAARSRPVMGERRMDAG